MRVRAERNEVTIWYRICKPLIRWGVTRIVQYELEGLENLPERGGCILAPNHQSVLDPLLLQAILPRAVDSMTKSTQFSHGFFRWLLPRVHTFPTRRYRVDPQCVRVLFRKLEADRIVCVYPEGERSWDGTLQPFRRGTLKVFLRAGVPVVPVGIEGMYDVWPRWARRPEKGRAVIRIGKPIDFGVRRGKRAVEAALPEAEQRLRTALLELSGEARGEQSRLETTADESGRRSAEPF